MKKIISFTLLLFICFPSFVFAHGGVEKTVDNIVVTLYQSPLSPFVGENVTFSFILTNAKTLQRLPHKTVRLAVIETTVGDASKDKIVYQNTVESDVNGTITFSDTFYKTNYYDIELQFGKGNDPIHSTGFLVQPRDTFTSTAKILSLLLLVSVVGNIVMFFQVLGKKKIKKKK